MMNTTSIVDVTYTQYLSSWLDNLPSLSVLDVFKDPGSCAVLSVDVINGFCSQGPLASPRVARIVGPVVALFQAAWDQGVRNFVLAQDTHDPQAVEFESWPDHCVRGTQESEAVDALKALPFYSQISTIPKNSIHAAMNTALPAWMEERPNLETFVVVGDCTDLCTYQLAMHLRLYANAHQCRRRVIVPADCVDTYDLPLEIALKSGSIPHPAEILHPLFLQHMALNGVEVVKTIQ